MTTSQAIHPVRYGAGWQTPFGKELEKMNEQLAKLLPEQEVWYRNACRGYGLFGRRFPLSNTYLTPGEAQWMIDQIINNNCKANLEKLCGGAERLCIVEVRPTYPERTVSLWDSLTITKYETADHIIPVAPTKGS